VEINKYKANIYTDFMILSFHRPHRSQSSQKHTLTLHRLFQNRTVPRASSVES